MLLFVVVCSLHHCVGFLFLACTPALPVRLRPSARPRPPTNPARRPTYTNQRTASNAHQRTGRATYTNQLPTHIKQCTPTNSPSNVHQPTTNRHQACRPTNSHQPTRTKQCVEGSSLLVSRAAKPWQGRTLESSGGIGACFWTRWFCVEVSSLKGRHFWSRGPRNPGKGVL